MIPTLHWAINIWHRRGYMPEDWPYSSFPGHLKLEGGRKMSPSPSDQTHSMKILTTVKGHIYVTWTWRQEERMKQVHRDEKWQERPGSFQKPTSSAFLRPSSVFILGYHEIPIHPRGNFWRILKWHRKKESRTGPMTGSLLPFQALPLLLGHRVLRNPQGWVGVVEAIRRHLRVSEQQWTASITV